MYVKTEKYLLILPELIQSSFKAKGDDHLGGDDLFWQTVRGLCNSVCEVVLAPGPLTLTPYFSTTLTYILTINNLFIAYRSLKARVRLEERGVLGSGQVKKGVITVAHTCTGHICECSPRGMWCCHLTFRLWRSSQMFVRLPA